MREATQITYDVAVFDSGGTAHHLPYSGLSWQRQPQQQATQITFSVPDLVDEDGDWLGSFLGNGLPLLISATDENGNTFEVLRGNVRGRQKGLDGQAPIQVRGYDLLFPLTKSKGFVRYYDASTQALDVLTDLAGEFAIPLGQVDGLQVVIGPLHYANTKPSTVLADIVGKARLAGDGEHVVRWNGGSLEVVAPGGNSTVYWVVEGESVLGGEEDVSAEDLVTRVRIYRTANADPSDTQLQQESGTYTATQDDSPPAEIAVVDGNTAFGIFQECVILKKNDDADAAVAAAQAELAQSGGDTTTLRVIAPLLPDVLFGDKIHVTAGTTDGYLYINGLSADTDTTTMQLDLVPLTSAFENDLPDTSETSDDESASDTLPDGTSAAQLGSGAIGASSGSQWQTLAQSAIGSLYNWGGPKGRTDFSQPFGPGGTGAASGSDCSGYVAWVYQNAFGMTLTAQTATMIQQTQPLDESQAEPGDLIFFNMATGDPTQEHVAIYLGNGQMIHDSSMNPNGGVQITPVWTGQSAQYVRVPGGPNG